jgi:hypothetical protein
MDLPTYPPGNPNLTQGWIPRSKSVAVLYPVAPHVPATCNVEWIDGTMALKEILTSGLVHLNDTHILSSDVKDAVVSFSLSESSVCA